MRLMCYTPFQEGLKPNLLSTMPPPALAGTLHKLNAFYRIDNEEDRKTLSAGVQTLEYAVHYDRWTGEVSMAEGVDSLRALCAALVKIESSKVRTFARVALKALRLDSQQKVVICVNYIDSLQRLQDLSSAYLPLVRTARCLSKNESTSSTSFSFRPMSTGCCWGTSPSAQLA
jgi:hypothetical protein